ncbi:hypothetical protein STAS_05015 [Striga asiatica]|uniref:Nuclease associated modular domain-containing protein n=1 Tax=Striga asiatica TaxID=4170 RepID=A0A5A7P9L1_STRAF|nr:hypothetical protein STAS_05015 [Striga asiatica]
MSITFYSPSTNLPNFAGYVIEQHRTFPASPLEKNNLCPCVGLALFSSFDAGQCYSSSRAIVHKHIHPWRRKVLESCKGMVNPDPVGAPPTVNDDDSPQRRRRRRNTDDNEDDGKRRMKLVHGNKGCVPWNKGIKHSEETRERISRRTKEALSDPKIRKKMAEAPRTMSNLTKARIRTSLTRLWGERLKWKRSREKFMQLWAESIAKAAKVGMSDEKELDWDSYDKLAEELTLLWVQKTEQQAKDEKIARLRAAYVKAEKAARLSQKRREREENARPREGSIKKRSQKSKEERERLAEFREEKLKERLMKIHKKKSSIKQVSSDHQRPWEKLDLDLAKGLKKETSLADQIHFAKSRK